MKVRNTSDQLCENNKDYDSFRVNFTISGIDDGSDAQPPSTRIVFRQIQ